MADLLQGLLHSSVLSCGINLKPLQLGYLSGVQLALNRVVTQPLLIGCVRVNNLLQAARHLKELLLQAGDLLHTPIAHRGPLAGQDQPSAYNLYAALEQVVFRDRPDQFFIIGGQIKTYP